MQSLQTQVKLVALVLENRLARLQNGQPLGHRGRAAPRQPDVVLDDLDRQATFAERLDQMQLCDVVLGKGTHAALVAREVWKEAALVVVAYGERRNAGHVGDFADTMAKVALAGRDAAGMLVVCAHLHGAAFLQGAIPACTGTQAVLPIYLE